MQDKSLYLFTDDSGTAKFGDDEDSIFSLCTVVIDEPGLIESDKRFGAFKREFGDKLGISIGSLHNIEIEDGLLRGEGKYQMLKTNRTLADDFINALTTLLRGIDYRLMSIVFETQPYLEWLDAEVAKYYRGVPVKSSPDPTAIFSTTYFFQLKHLFKLQLQAEYDHFFFFVEERNEISTNTKGFLETGISVLFKGKNAPLTLNVRKSSDDYRSAMEIADLCANTLRKQTINPQLRSREYEVIKDKVILNKKLSVEDFRKGYGELKNASPAR